MWVGIVSAPDFFTADRWIVSFFTETSGGEYSAFPMRPLKELVVERRGALDPQQLGEVEITYLGLENVRPLTGELVNFAPRPASAIKSRSKVFGADDVLYGRLRPELNKVYLAQGRVTEGVCSGEFIVLTPNTDYVLPRYLRHALASSFVSQFVSKFKVGASLPRMGVKDLLGIEIPVPPLDVQTRMVSRLEEIDAEVEELRNKLEHLPLQQAKAFVSSISWGSGEIKLDV